MHIRLRQINKALLVAIILVNGYIIAAPFVPQVSFWWQKHHSHIQADLSSRLHTSISSKHTPKSQSNQLIIPKLLIDTPILEAPNQDAFGVLKQGAWHRPNTSTPDKGGNTVIAGHRFSYTGPHGIFYFLNKLSVGDEIGVIWQNHTYLYKVVSSQVVPPSDGNVEANTPGSELTLYTCTPLWNPVNRLVVVAKLESKS